MASTASIHGHPIHPMLVAFPIGLWGFSFISDLVFLAGGEEAWRLTAFYTMGGGIVGALLAAVPGMIDLFTVRDAHIRRIGLIHMSLNLLIVLLFIVNFWWRHYGGPEAYGPIWLSGIAMGLLVIAGWLGGEMVYVHSAAVDVQPKAKIRGR